MTVPQMIFISGLFVSCLFALMTGIRILTKFNIDDHTEPKGKILPAFLFSITGAMSPTKKETAYLHFPTYSAGVLYHLGSFLAFFWIFVYFFQLSLPLWMGRISGPFLLISAGFGVFIFVKRIVNQKLRHLSTPDDYFSNLLVTGFQFVVSMVSLGLLPSSWALIHGGIVLLYLPVGKLRHVVFFLIARFYLGWFYGKRGVWPPKRRNSWQAQNR